MIFVGDIMEYIRLNNNDNHLSLGNLFNAIKKLSVNKTSAIQSEIFCTIFNIDSISDTTINNYCTGYRSIGNQYKQIYINLKKHYQEDDNVLIDIINNVLSIIDGLLYSYKRISELNKNTSLKKLCITLNTYLKNDLDVSVKLKKELVRFLKKEDYYHYLCEILFFVILDKRQPIYEKDLVNDTIEEILINTGLSVGALKEYLSIKFKEGISFTSSLKKLAKNSNPYALYELGNLEYTGRIIGYPRYEEAFNYHLKASNFDHPTSTWMIAHMIINKKIGSLSDDDIIMAHKYLDKAISLNSVSALNTKGLTYLRGINLNKEKNIEKAIEYFEKAASKGYVYAYNNLGKIYEEDKNIKKALDCYQHSADEEESWACNKMGLIYLEGKYLDKDLKKAYGYFDRGSSSSIDSLCPWNIYNLVKYFYMTGASTLGITKDLDKSLRYLTIIKDFKPAYELFLDIYYELYLNDKKYEENVKYYLELVNNNYPIKKKKEIQKSLNNKYQILLNQISIDI